MDFLTFMKESGNGTTPPTNEAPVVGSKNEFPITAFPQRYQRIIKEREEETNDHASHLGSGILAAVSGMTGNTHRVQVAPKYPTLPISLWVFLIDSSGAGKTPAAMFALDSVFKKQSKIDKEFEKNEEDRAKQIADLEMQLRETKNKDEKGAIIAQLNELRERENTADTFIVEDVTMETLYKILYRNPRGIVSFYDELATWLNALGKYSKSGGDDEDSKLIKIYNGLDIWYNRASKRYVIQQPFQTVIGGTQPSLLNNLFGTKTRFATGFTFRGLINWPDERPLPPLDLLGNRDSNLKAELGQLIERCADFHYFPEHGPQIMQYSTEAMRVAEEYLNEKRDLLNAQHLDDITRDFFQSIHAKMVMNLYRISGVMEIIKWTVGESNKIEISADTVRRSIQLAEYYEKCAKKLYEFVSFTKFKTGEVGQKGVDFMKLFNHKGKITREELIAQCEIKYGVAERTVDRYLKVAKKKNLIRYDKKDGMYVLISKR